MAVLMGLIIRLLVVRITMELIRILFLSSHFLLQKIRNNEKVPLYGDGSNIRDWLYVEDHCDAIWEVLLVQEDDLYTMSEGTMNIVILRLQKYFFTLCENEKNLSHLFLIGLDMTSDMLSMLPRSRMNSDGFRK